MFYFSVLFFDFCRSSTCIISKASSSTFPLFSSELTLLSQQKEASAVATSCLVLFLILYDFMRHDVSVLSFEVPLLLYRYEIVYLYDVKSHALR